MKWLDRLLGRTPPDVQAEQAEAERELRELHIAFDKVQKRTTKLERELLRVNSALRIKLRQPGPQ